MDEIFSRGNWSSTLERHAHERGRGSGRRGRAARPPRPGHADPSAAAVGVRRAWLPWLLQTPALIVLGGLLVFPLVWVVVLSFQDFGLRELVTGEVRWIGLGNFREILSDPLLWKVALPNTVVFAAVSVDAHGGARHAGRAAAVPARAVGARHPDQRDHGGLGDARGHRHLRVGLLFDARDGIVMRLLGQHRPGRPGDHELVHRTAPVLRDRHPERRAPRVPVRRRHGARRAPHGAARAARGRGRSTAPGPWRRFWRVTYPLMKPVFAVVMMLSTIWDFKVFTQIYLMPGGSGTNRDVLNLGTWSYLNAISQNRYGLGAAIAVLLTVLLLVITVVYLRTSVPAGGAVTEAAVGPVRARSPRRRRRGAVVTASASSPCWSSACSRC